MRPRRSKRERQVDFLQILARVELLRRQARSTQDSEDLLETTTVLSPNGEKEHLAPGLGHSLLDDDHGQANRAGVSESFSIPVVSPRFSKGKQAAEMSAIPSSPGVRLGSTV